MQVWAAGFAETARNRRKRQCLRDLGGIYTANAGGMTDQNRTSIMKTLRAGPFRVTREAANAFQIAHFAYQYHIFDPADGLDVGVYVNCRTARR